MQKHKFHCMLHCSALVLSALLLLPFSAAWAAAPAWHAVFPAGGGNIPYLNTQACSPALGNCVLMQNSDVAVYSPSSAGDVFEVFDPYGGGGGSFSISDMVSGGGKYVAAGTYYDPANFVPHTVIMLSADGLQWNVYSHANPASTLANVQYINGLGWDPYGSSFLLYAWNGSGTDIYASSDGVQWSFDSTVPSTISGLVVGDPYGATRVAFTQPWNASPVFYTQHAGGAWRQAPALPAGLTQPVFSVRWNPKAAGGRGMFVAVGSGPTILFSQDGYSWSSVATGNLPPLGLSDVAFDDQGVAVAVGDHIVLLASDGYSNWYPVPGIAQNLRHVDWDGHRFVASGGQSVLSSNDGVSWKTWGAAGSGVALADLVFSPYGAVAVGNSGKILASSDGAFWVDKSITSSWTGSLPDFRAAAFNGINGCFVLAGQEGGAGVLRYQCNTANPSPFGYFNRAWLTNVIPGGTLKPLNDIAANNIVGDPYAGTVVAVGDGGHIIYHTASAYLGSGWQQGNSGSTVNLAAVTHGRDQNGGIFVAVGSGGTVLTSRDGYSWSQPNTGLAVRLIDVQWIANLNKFVAVGFSTVYTSPDGVAWTNITTVPASAFGFSAIGFDGTDVLLGRSWSRGMWRTTDMINWTFDPYAMPVASITTNLANTAMAIEWSSSRIHRYFADTTPPSIFFPSGISQWILPASDASGLLASDPLVRQLLGGVYAYDTVDGYLFSTLTNNLTQTRLPIGTTVVDFYATDKSGNQAGPASLSITVVDQTAPVVIPPAALTVEATSALGTDQGNPLIQGFLAAASVSDNVDANLVILNDAPSVFPLGVTTVTFWAYDAAGNLGQAQSTVTVTTGQSGTIGKAACLAPVSGSGFVWVTLGMLIFAAGWMRLRRG